MRNYTVTAHTGNEGTPDNSLASIRSAAAHGADIVEFDLLYREGTDFPVMRHSHPVPMNAATVEHGFAELAKTKLRVNIDVKDPSHIDVVMKLAEKYGVRERCFFTGVGLDCVDAVRAQAPGNVYYLNYGIDDDKNEDPDYIADVVNKVRDCGAVGLNTHYGAVTKALADALHKAGLELSVWTLNNFEDYKRMVALGADNITTCYPSFDKKL